MNRAIDLLISAILTLAGFVIEATAVADAFVAALLYKLGVPAPAQIILLIAAAIWLVVIAFRLLGRVFAAMFIVLMTLLIIHRAVPNNAAPVPHVSPGPDAPETIHTGSTDQ